MVADSVVCFQYSSFLIYFILFILLFLSKSPPPILPLTKRTSFSREKYFPHSWRVGGRNNNQVSLGITFTFSTSWWYGLLDAEFCLSSRRAWCWKYFFKQKCNDYKCSFFLKGGVKISNSQKCVYFLNLIVLLLKKVRQTALRCIYCISNRFQYS